MVERIRAMMGEDDEEDDDETTTSPFMGCFDGYAKGREAMVEDKLRSRLALLWYGIELEETEEIVSMASTVVEIGDMTVTLSCTDEEKIDVVGSDRGDCLMVDDVELEDMEVP